MDVSIIIVNYKSPELILDCLNSLFLETKHITFEIIIVDNHSEDNSKQQILAKYPDVVWLQMSYNAGFARANNSGIKIAKGKYCLLLNSDTLILDNAITELVKRLEQYTEIAAASVQLLNSDNTFQNAGNFFVKGGLNILLTLPVLNIIAKKIGTLLKIKKPSLQTSEDKINDVDWISGAFMFVRKSVLEKTGLMDEDFFLFSEEIEWCSRLKKAGKIVVYTDVKTIHLEGGTTKMLEKKEVSSYYEYWTTKGLQLMLSTLLRIRKQYNIAWMLLILFFFIIEIPVLFIAALFSEQYTLQQVKKYILNVISLLKYIPKIISNNPYFYKIM